MCGVIQPCSVVDVGYLHIHIHTPSLDRERERGSMVPFIHQKRNGAGTQLVHVPHGPWRRVDPMPFKSGFPLLIATSPTSHHKLFFSLFSFSLPLPLPIPNPKQISLSIRNRTSFLIYYYYYYFFYLSENITKSRPNLPSFCFFSQFPEPSLLFTQSSPTQYSISDSMDDDALSIFIIIMT